MFERYTDRARRVLVIAQDEARNLGLLRIGAGHLLLGLIGEDGGVAAVALKSLGADLGEARRVMGRNRGAGTPAGPLPFTSRVRGVLDQAATEAAALGIPYISTEHLLLALISDSEGTGNDPLAVIGINPGDARAKVMELLRGYEEAGERAPEPTGDDPLSAALDLYRSVHRETAYRGDRVCDSDHHRWPCDASRMLDALDFLSTSHAAYVSRAEYDRLVAILTGEADGG